MYAMKSEHKKDSQFKIRFPKLPRFGLIKNKYIRKEKRVWEGSTNQF